MPTKPPNVNCEDLAAVPIEVVASIAATLSHPKSSSHDTVERAYRLLEVAAEARRELKKGNSYEEGIWKHRELLKWWEGYLQKNAFLKGLTRNDENGNPLPVPFDVGLAKIMGRSKKINRAQEFKKWVMDTEELRDLDLPLYDSEAADKLIARWEKYGIPFYVFELAWSGFSAWKQKSISKARSQAGKKSAAIRAAEEQTPTPKKINGTKGRVRKKETDKRLGSHRQ
jgi:hypothetical protein